MIFNLIRHHEILVSIFGTLGVAALVNYLMKRTRRLITRHGEAIINGTFWILERILTRSISANLSMARYCIIQLSNESGKYLQVPGSRNLALDVDDVFVPLTLQLGGRNKTFTNANLLDAGSRLIVVGDPGCGKSTLVKRIFRDTCRDTQSRRSKGRLPIRLELKNLTPPPEIKNEVDAGNWMMGILRNSVSKVEGFEMSRLFDSWSVDAGLLILLDGLDEVSSEKYSVISAGIRGLSQRLAELTPSNTVVLTMRIQFHQQVRREFEEDYPQVLYVRQFSPNEIFTFLNKWPFDKGDRKDKDKEGAVNRIYGELTDRPTLREMCSNPLVLAMYVENDYESATNDAPDTRTQFYEKVTTELLIKRRRRQDIATGRSIGLRDRREQILGELALENLLDPNQSANSLSWVKAVALTQDVCNCSASNAEGMLRELARETGLISEERSGESLRFIHLTFCEFLAANQCAKGRENGWEAVLNSHRKFVVSGEPQLQTRLVEVLPFAHALLPRIQRNRAFSDVAALNDRQVLGRCFLETQLYGQPEWTNYLRDEREYLAGTSEDGWNEGKIRRLHLFSVVVRDARDWHSEVAHVNIESELEHVFTDIVKGNSGVVAKVFATYAGQDAAAAVRLAEQVGLDMLAEYPNLLVESCQEEPFLALALAGLKTSSANLWAAILVESALLHSNVTYRLNSVPCSNDNPLRDVNHRHTRLLRLSLVKRGTWYELLLSNVLDESTDRRLSAISVLKSCIGRASVHYFIYRFRYITTFCIFLLGLVAISPIFNLFSAQVQNYLVLPAAVLIIVISLSFYVLAFQIQWVYKALFDFVEYLNQEHSKYDPGKILLKLSKIRKSFLVPQVKALVQITNLRQAEPYPAVRYLYPPKSAPKS